MKYLLVQNQTTVLLGPIEWRARFIQSELNDLVDSGEKATPYTISPSESGYIDCGDGFEIFPIVASQGSDHNPIYQQLAGPFYTYDDNQASEVYNVLDRDIPYVKQSLKQLAKIERQRKQLLGTTVTINGTGVSLLTDADELANFVSLLSSIGESSVNWKFKEGFVTLVKANVQSIVDAIRSHIQTQFDWEKTIGETIDAASDVDTLKAIVISTATTPTVEPLNVIE
jgi:hypothetical protein